MGGILFIKREKKREGKNELFAKKERGRKYYSLKEREKREGGKSTIREREREKPYYSQPLRGPIFLFSLRSPRRRLSISLHTYRQKLSISAQLIATNSPLSSPLRYFQFWQSSKIQPRSFFPSRSFLFLFFPPPNVMSFKEKQKKKEKNRNKNTKIPQYPFYSGLHHHGHYFLLYLVLHFFPSSFSHRFVFLLPIPLLHLPALPLSPHLSPLLLPSFPTTSISPHSLQFLHPSFPSLLLLKKLQ